MKKLSLSLIMFALLFSFSAARAETDSLLVQAAQQNELELEKVGLLPTSQFYFLKEIKRGFQRFFTFSQTKKAELDLKIFDQKAKETVKQVLILQEKEPQNIEAITEAVIRYGEAKERLTRRLESLAQNKNIDDILEKKALQEIKHQKLFEDLVKIMELKKAEKADLSDIEEILDLEEDDLEDITDGLKTEFQEEPEKLVEDSIFCTMDYSPVCGVDGKTYSNTCVAELQNKVKIAYQGECSIKNRPILDKVENLLGDFDLKVEVKPDATSQVPLEPEVSSSPEVISEPKIIEFVLEADDYGFYPTRELVIEKGSKVKLTFKVRTTGVYYGGLDFRSSKFKTEPIKPGDSVTVEFLADEPFQFSSYWPLSGVLKSTGKIIIK